MEILLFENRFTESIDPYLAPYGLNYDRWYDVMVHAYDSYLDEMNRALKKFYDSCEGFPECKDLRRTIKAIIDTPMYPPAQATFEELDAELTRRSLFLDKIDAMLTMFDVFEDNLYR